MICIDFARKIIPITIIASVLVYCSDSQKPADYLPDHITHLENLTVIAFDEETVSEITLVPDQTFGDTENVFIGSIKKVEVDDQDRVFIADFGEGRADAIYVFEKDGSFLTQIGREGEGPGEFRHIRDIKINKNQLFIYDGRQWIHIFELDSLTFSRTIVLNEDSFRDITELRSAFSGNDFFVREDDTFLVSYRQPISVSGSEDERYLFYYLRDAKGNIKPDPIFKQREIVFFDPGKKPAPGVPLPFTMPYTRSPLVAVSGDGRIFSAWSDDFLIKIFGPDGEYLRAFYYPYEKRNLSRREAINMTESGQFRRVLRDASLPETWPALHSMILDDKNQLWISSITDDEDEYQWWVLNEAGEPLGRFALPGERKKRAVEVIEQPVVKNGSFYTHETDEETGLQQVVRYRIEWND